MRPVNPPSEPELRALVEDCRNTLRKCDNELVKVAAGILDSEGRAFTAVQVRSLNCGQCSVCAEAIAIGMALTVSGSSDLVACVSVVRAGETTRVWSPCGSCRELLRDHEVGHVVVAEDNGQIVTVPGADLLPWP